MIIVGDHDLDGDHSQLTTYSGRGLLSESAGPVWLIGTGSEHHVIYNYGLVGAKNHYLGLIQVETVRTYLDPVSLMSLTSRRQPYWQPLASSARLAPASNAPERVAGNSSVSTIGANRAQEAFRTRPSPSKRGLEARAIPSGWTDGGCVVDTSARVLTGYTTTSASNSPTWCANTCASQ